MRLLDGNAGTVRQLMRQMGAQAASPAVSGGVSYFFSGAPADAQQRAQAARLLKRLEQMHAIR